MLCTRKDAMKARRTLLQKLKTLPGALAAAVATAVIGAGVAYFAPKILDSITGKNSIKIDVRTNPATVDTFSDLSQTFIVPTANTATGSPGPGCTEFAPWAAAAGGVRAGRTDIRLVAQGGDDQIFIGGIHARVLERDPPLKGTGYECPSAGAVTIRDVVIDLDDPSPIGQVVAGNKTKNVSFTVGAGETETFDITAWTEHCYCKWVLELDTTQNGSPKTITVTNDGAPFETTVWGPDPLAGFGSPPPGPYYLWNYEDAWSRSDNASKEYAVGAPRPELSTVSPSQHGG
jgi:hypothetical protein